VNADDVYNAGGYYGDQSSAAKLERVREAYARGKITLHDLETLIARALRQEERGA
jgi:hypothetical protein